MQKHLFLLFTIFINLPTVFGQDVKEENFNPNEIKIVYNARTGEASRYPSYEVSQNGYVIFEIKDINLFRYSVTLTELQNNVINSTKLSEGNTQVSIDPTLFNLTDLNLNIQVIPVVPNDETKALADLEKDKNDKVREIERKLWEIENAESKYFEALARKKIIDEIEKQMIQLDSELDFLENIAINDRTREEKELITQLEREKKLLETEKEKLNISNPIEQDKTLISDYIDTQKNKLESELNNLESELDEINHNYKKKILEDTSHNTWLQNFNTTLEAYIVSLRRLNELTDFYQRLLSLLYSDKSFGEIKVEKMKISQDVIKIEDATKDDILKYAYIRLRDIDRRFTDLSKAYSLITEIPDAKGAKEIFDKISAFNEQIKTNSYHAFFMQLAKVYDAINESNFTLRYQTLILSDNADLINFSLNAQPHGNIPASIETKPIHFKYDVKINGGVKIDVSTGIFWNIGLNDNTYRFESINDTLTRVIEEENENLFIPSFGVLFNLYKRSSKDVKFGGNIGFSTNTERLNYYLGASLLIGKSERININFGLAGTQVDRVSDLYNTSEPIPVAIKDLPNEVPLRNPSPFKIGGYFGVTFNLIGSKNKETLSQISAL